MDGRRLRGLIQAAHAALRRETIVAFGRTAPNPTVAAVVVAETPGGLKIFSGATEAPGGRHAETLEFGRWWGAIVNRVARERIRPQGACDPHLTLLLIS